jgi:excisionase family DNA binding protein
VKGCFPLSHVNPQTNSQANSQTKPARLISTEAAAKRLGVHPDTIRSFIANKQLKGYNVGRLTRLDAAEVEDFIKEIATGA